MENEKQTKKDERLELAKAITFFAEDDDGLNKLLHNVPDRFEYGELERKSEGGYRQVVIDNATNREHELVPNENLLENPRINPYLKEANQKDITYSSISHGEREPKPELTVLTEEEEEKNINQEFHLEEILKDIKEGKHKSNPDWKMKEIKYNCAVNAHKTNSLKEATLERIAGIRNIIIGAIPTATLIYGGYSLLTNDLDIPQKIAAGIFLGVPAVAALGWIAGMAFFGDHPISGCGNYFLEPTFGAGDHFELAGNWRKIEKLQKQGKIREGTQEVPKDRYLSVYYDVHGGP